MSYQNGVVEANSSVNTENLRSIRLDLHMTKESDREYNIMSDNFPWTELLHDFHKYKVQKMSEVEIYYLKIFSNGNLPQANLQLFPPGHPL